MGQQASLRPFSAKSVRVDVIHQLDTHGFVVELEENNGTILLSVYSATDTATFESSGVGGHVGRCLASTTTAATTKRRATDG